MNEDDTLFAPEQLAFVGFVGALSVLTVVVVAIALSLMP